MPSQKSTAAEQRLLDRRVLEVEIGLVGVEPMPVVGRATGSQDQFDGSKSWKMIRASRVTLGRVAPDVEVALGRAGRGAPGPLEPGMLVGGVVQHQLGNDANAAAVGLLDEQLEVGQRAVVGVDGGVVGDVVAVVAQRRGIKRQQPERRDAQVLEIIELLGQAPEITDAVAVAVEERPHVQPRR